MEPVEYLRLLRRRWPVLLGLLALGLVAGFLSAPSEGDSADPELEAVHTMLLDPASGVTAEANGRGDTNALEQYALLTEVGIVPDRAAEILGSSQTGAEVARGIDADADTTAGVLTITARGSNATRIEERANAFAQALLEFLNGENVERYNRALTQQTAAVDSLRVQVAELEDAVAQAELFGDEAAGLSAERDAVSSQYQVALDALRTLTTAGPPLPPLRTLQAAQAREPADVGFELPSSRSGRMLLIGGLGLVLGLAIAVLLDRIDNRVRLRTGLEKELGAPVLAEVPELSRHERSHQRLVTEVEPSSPFVEAYRSLRTMLLFHWMETSTNGDGQNGAASVPAKREAHVGLIVSPGPGEGKTTTVAHMAALFAESGLSVLVINADFRRPRVHELLGAQNSPGLAEVVQAGGRLSLGEIVRPTNIPGVKLLPSGAPVDNATHLVALTRKIVASARSLVDVVLIDTAPLLLANDAAELIGCSDAVVLVARGGQTSREAIAKASEVLRRLDAPLVGAVLIGSEDSKGSYNYSYRYAAAKPERRGIFGRGGRRGRPEPRGRRGRDGYGEPPSPRHRQYEDAGDESPYYAR